MVKGIVLEEIIETVFNKTGYVKEETLQTLNEYGAKLIDEKAQEEEAHAKTIDTQLGLYFKNARLLEPTFR